MRIAHAAGTLAVHTHYDLYVLGRSPFKIAINEPEGIPSFSYDICALDPSGATIVLQRACNVTPPSLSTVDVMTGGVRALRHHATLNFHDMTFVDASIVLAVAVLRDAPATRKSVSRYSKGWGSPAALFVGTLDTLGGEPVALPELVPVAWPSGEGRLWKTLPKSIEPWEDGAVSSKSQLTTNRFGHVLIDPVVGTVIRFEREDPRRCAAFRVRTEYPEVVVSAVATRSGFVVAHRGGRSTGAVNHFASDGSHLGGIQMQGSMSDIVVVEDEAMFLCESTEDGARLDLLRVSLPSLAILERVATSASTTEGIAALAANDDASTLWVGNGGRVEQLTRSTGAWARRPFDLPEPQLPSPPAETSAPAPAAPRRVVHPKFGEGTVVGQEGEGDEGKLDIDFASGRRKLQAKFVRDA